LQYHYHLQVVLLNVGALLIGVGQIFTTDLVMPLTAAQYLPRWRWRWCL